MGILHNQNVKAVKKETINKGLNLMKTDNQELLNYTKEVWQPYYEEELSENDAVEIIDNMTAFMNLLIKWRKAKKENELSSITPANAQKESCKISYIDNLKKETKNV